MIDTKIVKKIKYNSIGWDNILRKLKMKKILINNFIGGMNYIFGKFFKRNS